MEVTAQWLVGLVAILLAIIFDWFAPVAKWYEVKLEGEKRMWMALLLLITCVVVFLLGCFSIFTSNIACTVKGGTDLFVLLIEAVVINQGLHMLTKPSVVAKRKLGISG